MKYSLSDYKVQIKLPEDLAESLSIKTILSIGGNKSYMGSIEVSNSQSLWTLKDDATGSYVFEKNLSKSGTVSITINSLSPSTQYLKSILKAYYEYDYGTLDISIFERDNNKVDEAKDCLLEKIPDESRSETAPILTWNFLCGEIDRN